MKKNIFVTGRQVSGKSMIGYERYINVFVNLLLYSENNLSITGIPRVGKTSLAKEALRRVEAQYDGKLNVICVDLAGMHSFEEFLGSLSDKAMDIILLDEELGKDRVLNVYIKKLKTLAMTSQSYRDTLKAIFKQLSINFDYRTILMIDEFDVAQELFPSVAEYEFLRDICTDIDIKLTLVLVSRRQLYMIEKKNFNNSTFHGVVTTYNIRGFEDEEFEEFYALLQSEYSIVLGEKDRKRIYYYAGNLPLIWSIFGYNLVETVRNRQEKNIEMLFERSMIDINNYYKTIYACLLNDHISTEGACKEVCSIEKLMAVIFGPNLDLVQQDVDLLTSMGYLSNEEGRYYSLSQYFMLFLRNQNYQVDSWNMIITLEKKIKIMIRKQMQLKTGHEVISYDVWADLLTAIGAGCQLDMYDTFMENSMQSFSCDVDLLDVISLDLVISILQVEWESIYSKFFNNDSWSSWESKLRLCARVRNPLAHGHEEYLTSEERINVNTYCEEILKQLQSTDACTDVKTADLIRQAATIKAMQRKFFSLHTHDVEKEMVGKNTLFSAVLQQNKGIKGYIDYNGEYYKAFIGKNKWENCFPGVPIREHIGKIFQVKISKVNVSQNAIALELL